MVYTHSLYNYYLFNIDDLGFSVRWLAIPPTLDRPQPKPENARKNVIASRAVFARRGNLHACLEIASLRNDIHLSLLR